MSLSQGLECLAAVVGVVTVALPFLSVLPYLAMTLGLSSMHLRFTARGVALRGLDVGAAMLVVLIGVLVAIGLVVARQLEAGPQPWGREALLGLGTLAIARSCTVDLMVGCERDRWERRILGLAWRRRSPRNTKLFLDGWGDFMDPLALRMGDDETSFELGWFDSSYTAERPEAMVAELNAALSRARSSKRHEAV